MEPESPKPAGPVAPPFGVYSSRTDDKGRLKLPVDFQEFLGSFEEKSVIATTFDERIARLYPIPAWNETQKLLQEQGEDAQAAEDLFFIASRLGAKSGIDSQGRVLLPPELRRNLNLENVPVYLEYFKSYVNVYNQEVYDARTESARKDREQKLALLKKKGL